MGKRSVTSHEVNRRWTEGSVTFAKDNTYYYMYSANHYPGQNYSVGYANSNSPLGLFEKAANNPVLRKNAALGGSVTDTGHNSITYSPDGKEMFCVCHGRTAETRDEHVVFIDRMKVNNGKITVCGPTTTPQKATCPFLSNVRHNYHNPPLYLLSLDFSPTHRPSLLHLDKECGVRIELTTLVLHTNTHPLSIPDIDKNKNRLLLQ